MNKPSPLEQLVAGLNREEMQEFVDAVQYLDSHLSTPGPMPEGGAADVINRLSPNVRERFALLNELLETPRLMPFESKRSEGEWADSIGLDADKTSAVKAGLDTAYVADGLLNRMGGADRPSNAPPTRRESIAAALEASMPKGY